MPRTYREYMFLSKLLGYGCRCGMNSKQLSAVTLLITLSLTTHKLLLNTTLLASDITGWRLDLLFSLALFDLFPQLPLPYQSFIQKQNKISYAVMVRAYAFLLLWLWHQHSLLQDAVMMWHPTLLPIWDFARVDLQIAVAWGHRILSPKQSPVPHLSPNLRSTKTKKVHRKTSGRLGKALFQPPRAL